ncbi:hypothetical protein B0E45_12545 [Sinorhizobium sp. A49]|uniref:L-2-amino-thiazoline-4-carboxylic acid hydrolase n=1 Tax=Sinorhizobium sp. A49 TaxID=1945861 RepID=UPI000985DE3F|nr:L-2-amino-thiazoline-4-carboxylic acid hydrolase [Sinorhizobium sp. A49]OOG70844.1 hypothetical protein B0E45_12545 [Sinorhizobium sp. A49]
MGFVSAVALCLPNVAFKRAAMRRLAAQVSPEIATAIWRDAQILQRDLKRQRPKHSAGVNLLLRYMEWDCALYRAAREQGLSRDRAGALIEEINWDLFKAPIGSAFRVTRLLTRRMQTRIRRMLDAMFALVFTAPFKRSRTPSGEGLVFDVLACPLAAYFKQQGVPELTRHAACSLDYRMAAQWGAVLHRKQTIAEGAPHCDFRFTLQSGNGAESVLSPEPCKVSQTHKARRDF